jgi:hypothetical protein
MSWPFSKTKKDTAYEIGTLIADLQIIVQKLQNNWDDLKGHKTKHGGNPPVDLLNEIEDHRKALDLTKQILTAASELQQELGSLNIAGDLKAHLISILGEK